MENISGRATISEKIDFKLFTKAINLFVEKNDSFRLKFDVQNNKVMQYIEDYHELSFEKVLVSSDSDIKAIEKEVSKTPFELLNSLLFRLKLFEFPDGHGGFVIAIHHLICDAWTSGLVISQIIDLYSSLLKGEEITCDKEPSYLDYINSEQVYLNSDKFQKDKIFWNDLFSTVPECATIPYSNKNIVSNSVASKRKQFVIPKETMTLISEYCKSYKVSEFNFFMAILAIYLCRTSNLDEFVIGTPILNRSTFKEKHTAGMFISTVPFKISIDHNDNFRNFITRISKDFFNIFRHQKYPYQCLLEDLRKENPSVPNLYNIMMSYQNMRSNKQTADIPYESTWIPVDYTADDLDVHFYDINDTGDIIMAYDYQTQKYSLDDIFSLHARFLHMINQVLNTQDILLKDIEIVTPSEKDKLLCDFNNTKIDYPKDKTIAQLFEEQALKTPDNIAVVCNDEKLTYKELNEKATRLANYLSANNVAKNDVVSLCMDKNLNFIISIIATLKLGCSYLPINPTYPENRISYILNNSNSKAFITDTNYTFDSLFNVRINNLDFAKLSCNKLNIEYDSNSPAYIIYTSGSTGNPKGVIITHRNLINFIYSFNNCFNNKFSHNDNCLSLTNISFDVSVCEIFTPLVFGSTLVLHPENVLTDLELLCETITKNKITFLYIPPNILVDMYKLLKKNSSPISINKLLVGVDSIKNETLNNFLDLNSEMEIINGYGPTEATICSTFYKYTKSENPSQIVPIGSALPNNNIFIVHKPTNQLQPANVNGTLVICGDNVGNGYLNNSMLTDKSFNIQLPFNTHSSCYDTGDIVYIDNNGIIHFVGRKDSQIKFRGHRIELGEINNLIKSISGVNNSVTMLKNINSISCICSYVATKEAISSDQVKAYVKKQLPLYMVPSHIVIIPEFPVTENGKIDIKQLPEVILDSHNFVAPTSKIEKDIASVLQELLNIKKISINDNFFEIGMDSLSTIRFSLELNDKFNIKISAQDIFNYNTISLLGNYISSIGSSIDNLSIKTIEKSEYYLTSSAQKRIYYANNMAGENSILYNISGGIILDKTPDLEKLNKCFNTLVNRHEAFRTYFEVENDIIVQKVLDKVHFTIQTSNKKIDYSELDSCFEDFAKPFDLSKAPLLAVKLVLLTDNRSVLLVNMHHIISDGTSMLIFTKELNTLYNNGQLEDINFTYKDFAAFENLRLSSGDFKASEDFWMNQFTGDIPVLNMPTKSNRPSTKSYVGEKYFSTINKSLFNKICKISQDIGITPYMFLLSCYYILLSKYSGQDDIIIGSPIVGRDLTETYNMIGMFVNTLPLRADINSNKTFRDFADDIRKLCLEAFTHQSYPIDELLQKMKLKRDPSRNPLYDTIFTYQNSSTNNITVDFKGINAEYYIPDTKISKFDLSLEVVPTENSFELNFEYCTKLFDKDFVQTLINHYINIIDSVLNNLDIKVSDICMLSDSEKNTLLNDFNNMNLTYDTEKTVVKYFEEIASKYPDNVALVYKNERLTYKELNEKANSLCHYLIKNNVSNNDIVPVLLTRSPDLIISMLAIMKSGAAYLPISTEYPADRISYILQDCNAKLVLTNTVNNVITNDSINTILLDTFDYSKYSSKNSTVEITSKDTIYIIYTSGSTRKS